MIKQIALVSMVSLAFVGCATKVAITGKTYPPTSPEQITVFLSQKPTCEMEEIGLVVTNLKSSQEKAIASAKEKAAEVGATHMQIIEVTRNIYNDAAVQAVAFRCK